MPEKRFEKLDLTPEERRVVALWAEQICARADEVDPDSEHDWHSMFVGFAIACGLSPGSATNYYLYIDHAFKHEPEGHCARLCAQAGKNDTGDGNPGGAWFEPTETYYMPDTIRCLRCGRPVPAGWLVLTRAERKDLTAKFGIRPTCARCFTIRFLRGWGYDEQRAGEAFDSLATKA